MDLSIILINHNTKDLVAQTVESIIKTVKRTSFEVIVVDNSSKESQRYQSDNERVKVKRVSNKGFSNGCNLGAKQALGEYLLFLNSDSILKKDTIDESIEVIKQNKDIGVLGVKQQLLDGSLDHGCKRGFPTPMSSLYYFVGIDKLLPNSRRFGSYRQTFVKEDEVKEVDSVSGAYIMIKKGLFELIDGFDEDYFMYGEDIDLCYRVKASGFKVLYYGKVSFVHIKGQSGIDNELVLKNFYDSMIIFFNKHYAQRYNFLIKGIVKLGIKLKYGLARYKLKKRLKN